MPAFISNVPVIKYWPTGKVPGNVKFRFVPAPPFTENVAEKFVTAFPFKSATEMVKAPFSLVATRLATVICSEVFKPNTPDGMELATFIGKSPVNVGGVACIVHEFVAVESLNTSVGAGRFVCIPGETGSVKVNVWSTNPFVTIVFVQTIDALLNMPVVLKIEMPAGNGCVTTACNGMANGFATTICD